MWLIFTIFTLARISALLFLGQRCRRKKPVNVTTACANCTVSNAIPLFQIKVRHERGVQLHLVLPEDAMRANVAAKLVPSNNYRSIGAVSACFFTECSD